MAEAKPKAAEAEAEARTLEVWECAVCHQTTALDRCPRCAHSPKHDAERAKARS